MNDAPIMPIPALPPPPAEFIITPEIETVIQANLSKIFDGSISLDDLTKIVTKDDKLDGRSRAGRAIKKWFIDKGHKIKTSKYEKEGPYVLSEDEIEFITNNIGKMRPMEMARMLWPMKKITPLNREYLAIQVKIKEINPESLPESEKMADGIYEPPKSIYRLVPKINDYIARYRIDNATPLPMEEKKLNDRDLKNLRSLLNYLNNHTFIHAINIYDLIQERELFESKFIRYTYDKPDLTEEEVDQYILVCDKAVALHQLKKNIQVLQREISINLESGDAEKKKVAMSLIELLNSYRGKETEGEKMLESTLEDLVGTRNTRLAGKLTNNATVMNLVTAFQQEEKRKELLELAEEMRAAEAEAVKKLSSMDAVIALVAGYHTDDAING